VRHHDLNDGYGRRARAIGINIRTATAADSGPIGDLISEFQAYLRGLGDRTEFGFGASAYLRDGFGDSPAFEGLVAEVGQAIVGYALYHHGYDTDRGRRVLHLIDLYVPETWRRQGIGEALVRRVAEAGRAHGAEVMLWSVYKPNEMAMHFYERLGARYVENLRWMALDI
jgi:ribosomal protein S18 acetylase RimI-like enzyme